MAYIEFKNITKAYDDQIVLKDFSLDIEKGEFITLLGASGCGKSTLLRCLAGLESLDGGELFIDGENITSKNSNQRNVGMIFQQYSLFPTMNIYDNIAFGLKMKKRNKDEINKEVSTALKMVNLEGSENKYPSQLSGGEQQRVALARCIVTKPKVLLLDEPFSAIDAKLRRELQARIKEIHKELGVTSIFVTHDQDEAMIMSDKIHLMNKGVIAQSGAPAEIYLNPKTEYVASFIGEYNIFDWEGKRIAVRPEVIKISKKIFNFDNSIILKGEIADIITQKSIVRYMIKSGDKEIRADYIMNNNMDISTGDKVYVKINTNDILEYE